MSAQFVDALKGYEYYIENRGNVSIEKINDFLRSIGRSLIQKRTYEHYEKLLRYGFSSYIPINQFDVFRTLGRLQMASDRRRYIRENTQNKAIISTDGKVWIQANIINMSLVGFGMVTSNKLPIKPRTPIWVQIDHHNDIPATMVWKKPEKNLIRFGVRSFGFISNYRISDVMAHAKRPAGSLKIKKASGGDITWQEFFRILEKTDELIDATSVLLAYLAKIVNRDISIAPPILSSIKFSSPGEFLLNIDPSIIGLIIVLVRALQLWRIEKERYKEETRTIKLRNDMREIEVIRKAIKLKREIPDLEITKKLPDELTASVKDILQIKKLPFSLFEPDSYETGILKERVLPAAAELTAGDNPDFKIEVKIDISKK